jgi:uncharacterized protein (DUF1778 family)
MSTLNHLSSPKKSARLNLRILPQRKRLIEQAAALEHTTPSEFIVRTVVERAERIITEQCHFFLEEEKWEKFCKCLDAPPRDIQALIKLFSEKTPLEEIET